VFQCLYRRDSNTFNKVAFVLFLRVQVSLPESEVKAGLSLQPQALEVSLVDRPLTDLLFSQFLASVSGKVYCLGEDLFLCCWKNIF